MGEDWLSPTLWFPKMRGENVGENSMGKLTAVAVKAALLNPGTYQDSDGLF